ncbi:MAG: hypothetical protein LKI18_05735 [Prevotella sp.]|jgi:hypothetical protein|nr:hypothetical protein [Prevotella sp.]
MTEKEREYCETLQEVVKIYNKFHKSIFKIYDDQNLTSDVKRSLIESIFNEAKKEMDSIDKEEEYLLKNIYELVKKALLYKI